MHLERLWADGRISVERGKAARHASGDLVDEPHRMAPGEILHRRGGRLAMTELAPEGTVSLEGFANDFEPPRGLRMRSRIVVQKAGVIDERGRHGAPP